MSQPTREDLLGYLLGALERTEHEQVEQQLEANPKLRNDLAELQRIVAQMGLDDSPPHEEAPVGLASRTCQFVDGLVDHEVQVLPAPAAVVARSPQTGARLNDGRSQHSFTDMLVAAGVLAAAAALFFPALASSRYQAQISVCQNNQRQLASAMQSYSDAQPDHSLPAVQMVGRRAAAGVYAPILASGKWVSDPRVFVCPSSQLATQLDGWKIPSLAELDQATGAELSEYQRSMGGSFGYTLGYLDNGQLQPPRNQRRAQYAILADAPSDAQPQRSSENHLGRGQNVLFEDGHVEFLPAERPRLIADDPFHNRNGVVAAGCDRDDSVIGNSADRPVPFDWVEEGQ